MATCFLLFPCPQYVSHLSLRSFPSQNSGLYEAALPLLGSTLGAVPGIHRPGVGAFASGKTDTTKSDAQSLSDSAVVDALARVSGLDAMGRITNPHLTPALRILFAALARAPLLGLSSAPGE